MSTTTTSSEALPFTLIGEKIPVNIQRHPYDVMHAVLKLLPNDLPDLEKLYAQINDIMGTALFAPPERRGDVWRELQDSVISTGLDGRIEPGSDLDRKIGDIWCDIVKVPVVRNLKKRKSELPVDSLEDDGKYPTLAKLGLLQYRKLFEEQAITEDMFHMLTEKQLSKWIKIPFLGHRFAILKEIKQSADTQSDSKKRKTVNLKDQEPLGPGERESLPTSDRGLKEQHVIAGLINKNEDE